MATGNHPHQARGARPYLATLPVDLSGVPGVSDEDVAEAEALVTESLRTLPRFADIATLVALGYRTIGDAHTGFEHFVNWDLIADGRVLDPDFPESLVFKVDTATGEKTLGGAMFMANPGDTLDTVPDRGRRPGAVARPRRPLLRRGTERLAGARRRRARPELPAGHLPAEPTCRADGPRVDRPPRVRPVRAPSRATAPGRSGPGEQRLCDHAHGAPGDPG